MKTKMLRMLVTARQYANTEQGERNITKCLTFLMGVLIIDVALLTVGIIL